MEKKLAVVEASNEGRKEVSGKVLVLVQMADGGDTDKNIEIWKIKKLIKALESARGNGTSMISLIMPPRSHSFFTLFSSLRESACCCWIWS